MKCNYCGKELEDDSTFCGYCGKKQPSVKHCVKCGHEIDIEDSFCGFCGASQEISEPKDIAEKEVVGQKEESIEQNESSPKDSSENIDSPINEDKEPAEVEDSHHAEELSNEVEDIHVQEEQHNVELNEEANVEIPSSTEGTGGKSSIKKIAIVVSLLILLGIGGYYIYSSFFSNHSSESEHIANNDSITVSSQEEFKTEKVYYQKDNKYGKTEIKIDYPVSGYEKLVNTIRNFIVDELTDTYTYADYEETKQRYTGDISDGKTLVEFYGNYNMSRFKEIDSKVEESIKILIKKEDEHSVTYEVLYSWFAGTIPSNVTKGVTFIKKNGERLTLIKNKEDREFKELLISTVKKERDRTVFNESFYENPIPKTEPILTDEGLEFFYYRGEIAAMIEGEIYVTIPYSKVSRFLTEDAKIVINNKSSNNNKKEENTEIVSITFNEVYNMINPNKRHSEKFIEEYFESKHLDKIIEERYLNEAYGNTPCIEYCWGKGIEYKGFKLLPTASVFFGIYFNLHCWEENNCQILKFRILSSSKEWYEKFNKDAEEKGITKGSSGNVYINDFSSDGQYEIEIGYSDPNVDY